MQMHCMYTLDDSGFLKNFLYQGGLKSTVSCVFVFVSCLSLAETANCKTVDLTPP